MTNKLYAFEGLDDTGKSTQIGILAEQYGLKAFRSPESPFRQLAISPDINASARGYAMLASREHQLDSIIDACKADGSAFVDRFLLSSWAYQLDALDASILCFAEQQILDKLKDANIELITVLFHPVDFEAWWQHKQKATPDGSDAFDRADKAQYFKIYNRYIGFAQTRAWQIVLIDPLIKPIDETSNILRHMLCLA